MRTELWRRCLEAYLVPDLPGSWGVADEFFYRKPVSWLLCGAVWSQVRRSRMFTVKAFVQFIASPTTGINSPHILNLGQLAGGVWESPDKIADAEPLFRKLTELVKDHATPFWNNIGELDAFVADARNQVVKNRLDPYSYENLVNALIIEGDIAAAIGVSEALTATLQDSTPFPDWYHKVVTRTSEMAAVASGDRAEAMRMLHANAAKALSVFGIREELEPGL